MSVDVSGVLKSPTIIVLLSVSLFMSVFGDVLGMILRHAVISSLVGR